MLNFNFFKKSFINFAVYAAVLNSVYGQYYSAENNVVSLVNINADLCITYKTTNSYARMTNCNSSDLKQLWIVPKTGNGYYVNRYDPSICLRITESGSVTTTICSENKTVMGDISISKSKESIWTPENSVICMSVHEGDIASVSDESIRKTPTIKAKMYSCSSSNKYQHWKQKVVASNYAEGKITTTTKKTTTTTTTTKKTTTTTVATTTKKTTTTTKKTTTTTVATNTSSSKNAKYTPLTMNESDKELNNPYRGWFHGAVTVDLNDYPELDCNYINRFNQVKKYKNGLQYLGVRLAEYRDRKITKKGLAALDNLLNEYKKRKETIDPTTQVILRFYYDGENNCKTKDENSFEPLIAGEVDEKQDDTLSGNKFSQVDDGHLYVNYEDLQYLQDIYNPDILYENKAGDSVEIMAEATDSVEEVEELEEEINTEEVQFEVAGEFEEDESEVINNTRSIGYRNSDNELVVFDFNEGTNLADQIHLSEEDQRKLEYKNKYFDARYYDRYGNLNLKEEELKDYLKHSVFINDKLNKTRLLESNRITHRAEENDFIVKNATEKDLGNFSLNVAKELKSISFTQCVQYSSTNPNECTKKKNVNSYCIYQFKSSTGCELFTTPEIEPQNIDNILIHITQLSDIVNKYKDLIFIYQGSFVGTFGEMHHSDYLEIDSLTQIMDTIEKTFDPSLFMSVRTPRYYRGLKNRFNSDKGLNYASFKSRMGLYNDGLFYSESDYGTYGTSDISSNGGFVSATRAQEVEYQNNLCLNVPNGGEGVFNKKVVDSYQNLSDVKTIDSILKSPKTYINFYVSEAHARNIHLTYLNEEYDTKLFDHWAETSAKYINGTTWTVNGREYIANHLGYRYVIRSSKLSSSNVLSVVVENVGYAPAYVSFASTITLVSSSPSHTLIFKLKSDNRKWGFTKDGNNYVKTTTLTADLSQQLSKLKGTSYTVYFNVNDPRTGVDIEFGNSNARYDNLGYKVGVLTLS